MSASEDYNVTRGFFVEGDNELWQRILEAWRGMRASTARLIAEKPSEARLLFYVLLSDLFFFVSWSLKTLLYPTPTMAERMPLEMGYWLVIAMLFRTSFLYFFAMVIGSAARLLGGQGDWQATRTAVFWGALVAAPVGLAMGIVNVIFAGLEAQAPILGNPWVALAPFTLGLIPFVWYISEGVAQVHELKRTSGVFFAVTFVCSMGAIFGLYFKAQGYM